MQHNEKDLEKIKHQLGVLQQEIETIKEYCEITRESVNLLLEWADDTAIQKEPLLRRAK